MTAATLFIERNSDGDCCVSWRGSTRALLRSARESATQYRSESETVPYAGVLDVDEDSGFVRAYPRLWQQET